MPLRTSRFLRAALRALHERNVGPERGWVGGSASVDNADTQG